MITIFGPKNSRYAYTGTPCPHTDLAFVSNAETLGDAIQSYEQRFDVTIMPNVSLPGVSDDGGKYFMHTDNSTAVSVLVDIHIFRGTEEICPKQDMSFKLLQDDMVELGDLIC